MSMYQSSAWQYRELLRQSSQKQREASVLVGSGALRECGGGTFADWESILHFTADYLGVKHEPQLASSQPTIAWETLLRQAARVRDQQASACEADARRFVSGLIKEGDRQIDSRLSGGEGTALRSLIDRRNPRSVITLNFTPMPFCPLDCKPASTGDIVEYRSKDRSVWCLHGSHADPDQLRLGIVRYAALVAKFADWRNEYRMHLGDQLTLDVRDPQLCPQHRFVADVLESPLLIAGCGLRSAEWTLWWLLASKARNEARRDSCPSAFITADKVDDSQRLALEGLHCKTITVPHHSDVWSTLDFLLER